MGSQVRRGLPCVHCALAQSRDLASPVHRLASWLRRAHDDGVARAGCVVDPRGPRGDGVDGHRDDRRLCGAAVPVPRRCGRSVCDWRESASRGERRRGRLVRAEARLGGLRHRASVPIPVVPAEPDRAWSGIFRPDILNILGLGLAGTAWLCGKAIRSGRRAFWLLAPAVAIFALTPISPDVVVAHAIARPARGVHPPRQRIGCVPDLSVGRFRAARRIPRIAAGRCDG